MDYRSTINLPQTKFPMKAGLKEKEPKILKEWEDNKLYNQIREIRKNAPSFVLHDGPPYANGDIHVGTALNKIIKDIIVRYKTSQGFNSPYIPGWDCHGLPIELKVEEILGEKYQDTPKNIIRKKCRSYAQKQIDNQRKQFKRLGVMGDWDNPYLTMSKEYEAEIVSVFSQLVQKGYIYKGLKSIHWCIDCKTALAAAEIEYDELHISKSVYVKFPVLGKVNDKLVGNVNVMIWTTTPWTLPANVACAFNEELEYVAVKIGDEYSIMATGLVETVLAKEEIDYNESELIKVTTDEIKSLVIEHPFIEGRKSIVVFAPYVDDKSGTGIVHTAPGHGTDDFNTGIKNNLEIYCPVNEEGKYTYEFEMMKGVHITEANDKIIDLMRDNGKLFSTEKIEHSYPICWRCKKPVIFRTTNQWFMNMKHNNLEQKTIDSLSALRWVPKWGKERMTSMLKDRPDWCLSRQRAWGVPIPAFYCKDCGEALLTPETTKKVADIVKQNGIDVWFEMEASELLPDGIKCKCGSNNFGKESDILDVWFDSGVSSFALEQTHANEVQSGIDIYLEGGDQYRGWFQSSIWPSMAIKGVPPYRQLITHGWVLDEKGHAMHKSAGNTVSPLDIVYEYGADILRLWCISEDFTHNLRIGDNMMKAVSDNYRKIRNTFRYLLGNIHDFNFETDKVDTDKLLPVDRYALSKLHSFLKFSEEKLDNYEYHIFYQRLINYMSVDMSATYLDIIKDRLYCAKKDSLSRRSAQTVLYYMIESLVRVLTMFLPFTTEEIWKMHKGDENSSVHLQNWPKYDKNIINAEIEKEWDSILKVRDDVLLSLERARDNNTIGKSLEANVIINPKNEEVHNILSKYIKCLNESFIVSKVELTQNRDDSFTEGEVSYVKTIESKSEKCVRCWGHYESIGSDTNHPSLCGRCADAIG